MFDNIKSFFSKKKGFDLNNEQGLGKFYPIFNSPYALKKISRGDYLKLYSSWVYACVTTISSSVSDLDFQLLASKKSKREINHKYLNFITPKFLRNVSSFLK